MLNFKTKKKSNIVTGSYLKAKERKKVLQLEAKREREGRKLGPFLMDNQFREKYTIIKWDLLLDILLFAAFLWARELTFLAVFAFLQVYIVSYFIFNYRKYRLAPLLMSFSIIPFFFYFKFPLLDANFREGLYFSGWAILTYGAFWFIIIYKNRKEFKKAQELEVCMVCDQPKEEFVIHMGRYLCKECFLEQAYKTKKYNNIEIYQWDYDILIYFEHEIGEIIPNYNLNEDNDILNPEIEGKLFFSVEDKNVTAISIPNKNLAMNFPEEIGLLQTLRVLNFPGNKISKLPYSLRDLYHLKVINLRNNPLRYLPGHSLKTLTFIRRRGCVVLK
ncbi:MAG: hypothetical protein ACTSXK_10735 [Promethearchaeota archaeon]